jgi:hypothetical protein
MSNQHFGLNPKNVERLLAREHVVATFATRSDFLPAWRTPLDVAAASKPDLPEFHASADDGWATDDLAFESIFARVL